MITRLRRHLALLVALGATAFGTSAAVIPASSALAASGHPPIVKIRQGTSSNWSGYAAFGNPGTFSNVSATWVQPSVSCTSENRYSSFWVGLDGYSSSTVEQLGTEADCINGSPRYYSWYEMYPKAAYYASVTVTPGHSYTASVVAQNSKGGSFVLTLRDNTTGQSFSTTQKANSAKRASAEVIAEAPWSGGTLPLANFGTVNFTGSKANGTGIGTFPNIDPITMNNPAGMKATPSGFSDAAKQNFSITWSAS